MRTLTLTPRKAEILLDGVRGDLWRSNVTRKIYTSSETVTHQADALLRGGLLRVRPGSVGYRAERSGGPLVEGRYLEPTDQARALLARMPGWSMHCRHAGIGPGGSVVAADPSATGSHHHGALSLDDLAALGGRCEQADCPACYPPVTTCPGGC